MKISKTHVFDAPIEKVWAMFTDSASHVAKFEAMGHTNIEIEESTFDGTAFHLVVNRDVTVELPSFAAKVLKPTNRVRSIDDWKDPGDGTRTGTFSADAKGAPIDVRGNTHVASTDDGRTSYRVDAEIKVNVPLIGKKIEGFAKGNVEKQMVDEFACGDRWLADH